MTDNGSTVLGSERLAKFKAVNSPVGTILCLRSLHLNGVNAVYAINKQNQNKDEGYLNLFSM